MRRPGSCARPWRRCATTTRPRRTGSTTSRSWCSGPGPTGLDATLTIEGHRHDVPAAVDRTAYRIVQESLTNIARHAAAATASVRIDYRPDAVAHPGRRRRQGHAGHRAGARRRAARDARTGHRPRRSAARGTAQRGRLHRPGRTPRGPNVMIRVLLVDDQPLIRSGFRALLDVEDDIEVVAEAADGQRGPGAGQATPARHRAHRHPDAGHRRHRGDPAHRRGPGPGRRARRHPDQLRLGRVRLRRAARRRGRIPRQGHRAGGLPARRPRRRARRRPARTVDHPQADQPVRHPAAHAPAPTRG